MYNLIPITSIQTIYSAVLKIKKEDTSKIIENIDLLIGENNIKVKQEESNGYIKFHISSNSHRSLEVFYFKISTIANDNYIRRNKIEKTNK